MTIEEAKEHCRRYKDHAWTFEVADDGTVVVGGNDHTEARLQARAAGHNGPIVRVFDCER